MKIDFFRDNATMMRHIINKSPWQSSINRKRKKERGNTGFWSAWEPRRAHGPFPNGDRKEEKSFRYRFSQFYPCAYFTPQDSGDKGFSAGISKRKVCFWPPFFITISAAQQTDKQIRIRGQHKSIQKSGPAEQDKTQTSRDNQKRALIPQKRLRLCVYRKTTKHQRPVQTV